jgi:ATP-binding cassette, subfamily B, heavy metal transporter
VIIVMAGQGVVDGELTIGDLVAINAFLLQLFAPLGFLGTVYSILKHSMADMERMFSLLEEPPEIVDAKDAQPLKVRRGEIRFEGVEFAYNDDRPILKGIDLTVPPGHKVALVGPSGAGKSTIGRLLFRFYDPTSGRVAIDGQDISSVTQKSLRDAIGVVPQDTVLFNDTLRANILYARQDATEQELEEAARMANLDQFIDALPEGWDTVVGERGLKLSGGEKQRVAIARVILKAPPILLFDEATSSLDSESEQEIMTALARLAKDQTTLSIAHRLSTIIDSDRIIFLQEGQIIESGTHEELLAAGGRYAELWRIQAEEKES